LKNKLIHKLNKYYSLKLSDVEYIKSLNDKIAFDFFNKLNNFHKKPRYEIKEILIDDLIPLTKYVYNFRIKKTEQIYNFYLENKIDLYKPILLEWRNKINQYISPPIIEVHNDKYIVCDGMHRIFYAKMKKKQKIYCFIINNPSTEVPSDLNTLDNISIIENEVPIDENFINLKKDKLKGYTWIFNSEACFNIK